MGRPTKEIKYRLDQVSGRYMMGFAEKPLLVKDLAKNFFDTNGEWYRNQIQKGRSLTAASLSIRQGHIEN
jgi:hypothetical protein